MRTYYQIDFCFCDFPDFPDSETAAFRGYVNTSQGNSSLLLCEDAQSRPRAIRTIYRFIPGILPPSLAPRVPSLSRPMFLSPIVLVGQHFVDVPSNACNRSNLLGDRRAAESCGSFLIRGTHIPVDFFFDHYAAICSSPSRRTSASGRDLSQESSLAVPPQPFVLPIALRRAATIFARRDCARQENFPT